MGELLIVTGPPGAGKSTVAALLVERREPSALVEGDAMFGFLRRGWIAPWLPEANEQNEVVTDITGTVAGGFAAGGFWTVFDGIVGPWFLPRFVARTGLDQVTYAVLLPPVDVCTARVADRVGHGFRDHDATVHMHEQFVAALDGDRHVIRTEGADAATIADEIAARAAAGELRWGPG